MIEHLLAAGTAGAVLVAWHFLPPIRRHRERKKFIRR